MPESTEQPGGYGSPEEAAFAGWRGAGAEVTIVSTEIVGNRAEVQVDVGAAPRSLDWCYFVQRNGRWHETVSGNMPTHRWWDPTFLKWD